MWLPENFRLHMFKRCILFLLDSTVRDHLVQTVSIDCPWNYRLSGIKSSSSPSPAFPDEGSKAGRGEARTRRGSRDADGEHGLCLRALAVFLSGLFCLPLTLSENLPWAQSEIHLELIRKTNWVIILQSPTVFL